MLIYVPFLAVSMIAAPFLVAFFEMREGPCDNGAARELEPRLPEWLRWFMTPDNSLLGDTGWRTLHCADYWSYGGMVRWLWRNPAYGLAWGPFAYIPPTGAEYKRTDLPNGYRIDGSDGSYEFTRWYWGRLKVRTGWILGDAKPGQPALFLLSIRLKNQPE